MRGFGEQAASSFLTVSFTRLCGKRNLEGRSRGKSSSSEELRVRTVGLLPLLFFETS